MLSSVFSDVFLEVLDDGSSLVDDDDVGVREARLLPKPAP